MSLETTRFKVEVGYLNITSADGGVLYQDITSRILESSQISIREGVSGEESLHTYETPNLSIEVTGNLSLEDSSGYCVRAYSPVRVYERVTDGDFQLKFVGYVSPEDFEVKEETLGWPTTSLLLVSYFAFLNEMMLGTFDYGYRAQSPGYQDQDAGEAFVLYIKKERVLAPGVNMDDHPNEDPDDYSVDAEVAVLPSYFNYPGYVHVEDITLFERVRLYDSRMLSDLPSIHLETGGWALYTYNETFPNTAYIRYIDKDTEFDNIPLYWRTNKTLFDVLQNVCFNASRYFEGFQFHKAPWPTFRLGNTASDFPNLDIDGTVPLDLGSVWHFRYLEIPATGRQYMIVWHTQWEIEIFEFTNATTLTSVGGGTQTLAQRTPLTVQQGGSGSDFHARFPDYVFDSFNDYQYRYPIRYVQGTTDGYVGTHKDYDESTNVCHVSDDGQFIYILWTRVFATKYSRVVGGMNNGMYNGVVFYQHRIVRYDTVNDVFETTTFQGERYVLPGGHLGGVSQIDDPRLSDNANYQYPIPKSVTGNWEEAAGWGFQYQTPNTYVAEVGDGVTENWAMFCLENTPHPSQVSSIYDGSYVRNNLEMSYTGDIALDIIKFDFRDTTGGNILKLILQLTNALPKVTYESGDVVITLLPRRGEGINTYYLEYRQIWAGGLSQRQFRYINREDVPDFDITGLELPEPHRKLITRYYQDNYFLIAFDFNTLQVVAFGSSVPSWLVAVQVGDLILGTAEGSVVFGVVEHIITQEEEKILELRG